MSVCSSKGFFGGMEGLATVENLKNAEKVGTVSESIQDSELVGIASSDWYLNFWDMHTFPGNNSKKI